MRKFAGDIILIQICTKNHNHMMHGSWDMECDRQNFLSLWTVFCPFTPLTTWKIKILKNWKKTLDIIILHKCTKNHDHMLYCSLDVACQRFNCYFSFWTIFYRFTSLTAQEIKITQSEKNPWRYHHFTIVYQKSWPHATLFLRYGAWRM